MPREAYVRERPNGLWEVTDSGDTWGLMNSYPCAVTMAKNLVRHNKGCVKAYDIHGKMKVEYNYDIEVIEENVFLDSPETYGEPEPITGGFSNKCPRCNDTGEEEMLGGPNQVCQCKMDRLG